MNAGVTLTGYRMREGLSFCHVGEQMIFLDLSKDRYFALAGALESAFRALLTARAPATMAAAAQTLIAADIICKDAQAPSLLPCAVETARTSAIDHAGTRRTAFLPSGIIAHLLAAHDLATIPLKTILANTQLRASHSLPPEAGRQLAMAFHRSARVLGREDQCLVRSLALLRKLRRRGIPAKLVFGVKLGPFAAHCWVQSGDMLMSDRLEAIHPFTPILAT